MKYLIIDDNPKMRKIISQIIGLEEDSFKECADGIDASDAYAEYLPDYVLMDIQMKTMDGISATRKLRERFPAARIIIITDYDTPAFRKAAIKAGALAFISKENIIDIKKYI